MLGFFSRIRQFQRSAVIETAAAQCSCLLALEIQFGSAFPTLFRSARSCAGSSRRRCGILNARTGVQRIPMQASSQVFLDRRRMSSFCLRTEIGVRDPQDENSPPYLRANQ